jgi:signal-transduction protein with cAMP-binding, CBS, and nucleotidyltransferase domain
MEPSQQTSLFLRRVRDLMRPLPPILDLTATCLTALESMQKNSSGRVLISDINGCLIGILSAEDMLRQATLNPVATVPVQAVMTQPVYSVGEDTLLYQAVAVMRRQSLRQLPIVDSNNRPRGMLFLENVVDILLGKQLALIQSFVPEQRLETLPPSKDFQVELAAILLEQGVPSHNILAVLSYLNEEVYRTVLIQSIQELIAQGWGEPPVPFAAIVTGSLGRWESLLRPDQDNGFILADYPDAQYPLINDYFFELAQRMAQRLNAADIPLCIGYVMATNHAWRKRLSEWQSQFLGWLRRPSTASTTLLDIWIDFRGVFGDFQLVEQLRHFVTANAPLHHGFLRELETLQFDHDVAITPLRTLKRERLPGKFGHRKLDIKRKGIRPLIESVRILALRDGIASTETRVRLAALRERGTLKKELAEATAEAFRLLTELLLRAQLQDYREGRQPGAYVSLELLSPQQRKGLKVALRTVARLQNMVHAEFTAELF